MIVTIIVFIIILVIVIITITMNYDTSLVILIFNDVIYLYMLKSTHSKTQFCCTDDFLMTHLVIPNIAT
jgi:hypothetical protein